MCKHMDCLKEEWCGLCNPIKIKKKDKIIEPLEKEYKEKEHLFKDKRDIWTNDEIELVYEEFKCINKKDYKKRIYEVAIVLERTQLAIKWMIKHIFSKREDLHRGIEVIIFRKERGL